MQPIDGQNVCTQRYLTPRFPRSELPQFGRQEFDRFLVPCKCCNFTNSVFQVMPMTLNPSIKTLILKYNDFHSVDASFHFYPELTLVDLSSNELVSVPDRAFASQRRLQELRLGGNKISELTEKTFSGLSRLQSLDLSHNFLERLDNRVFKPLKSMKELNLESNRISEVEQRAFAGCSNLVSLNLGDNLLSKVPKDAFSHLTHLAELKLAGNSLRVITDSSFPSLPSLALLSLAGNLIEKIHDRGFTRVASVTRLDLHDNALYQVPTPALQAFSSLHSLSLGQNKFTVIQAGALGGLNKLKKLEIQGCPDLVEVSEDALAECLDLETLRISSNRRLVHLHPSSLGLLPSLRSLDLSNNALTNVSPSLAPWMALTSLDLSGNPWTCDCDSSFLRSAIINSVNQSESVRVVRCWNPPELRDRDLAFLKLDCSVVQSPNTDPGVQTTGYVGVLAVVVSVVVVSLVLLSAMVMVVTRKRMGSCLKGLHGRQRLPAAKEVLQYPEEREPRYVSSHHPTLRGGTYSPVIRVNPGFQQAGLLRHDQYFLTLARQTDSLLYSDSDFAIDPKTERVYRVQQPPEMIYQAVSDTQSDPVSDI